MSEEIKIEIPSEVAAPEIKENITPVEQAAVIVETAEELAFKMSRSSDESAAIISLLLELKAENESRHGDILARLEKQSSDISLLSSEIAMFVDSAEEVPEEVPEEPEIAAPVVAPVEVEQDETPKKRNRKWI